MSSRKRKADDDSDEMSVSPTGSPAIPSRHLARPSKKVRCGNEMMSGRPLSLPRLLETLDITQLRTVLQTICERRPEIGQEVVSGAPRPSVASALRVLGEHQDTFRAHIPYGQSSSGYEYERVRPYLEALVSALSDFTPQYLPPVEQQTNMSLQYLDGATKIIHSLPDWDSQQQRQHKDGAYDEISRAWALVITEASKRGGGFSLYTRGWEQVLAKHNQHSGGRLEQAMAAMANLGWTGGNLTAAPLNGAGPADQNSIRNSLMNGTYGSPVRVGPW